MKDLYIRYPPRIDSKVASMDEVSRLRLYHAIIDDNRPYIDRQYYDLMHRIVARRCRI